MCIRDRLCVATVVFILATFALFTLGSPLLWIVVGLGVLSLTGFAFGLVRRFIRLGDLDDLVEIGVTILNPVQPECMDPLAVRKRMGRRLAFDGCIGTQTTFPFGTPAEMRRTVQELAQALDGLKGGWRLDAGLVACRLVVGVGVDRGAGDRHRLRYDFHGRRGVPMTVMEALERAKRLHSQREASSRSSESPTKGAITATAVST
mgnify:CR=1 FL=1